MAKFGFYMLAGIVFWSLAWLMAYLFDVSVWATLVSILTARFVGGFVDLVGKDLGYIK